MQQKDQGDRNHLYLRSHIITDVLNKIVRS